MGQILFSGGNGGLVSSDELTANTNYVLDGKTYMGIDTDDEAGTGSMPNIASIDYGPSLVVSGDNLHCQMNYGAHIENATSGYPEVVYSLDKVRSAINYTDAEKVLNDTTICGMTGTMPNQGAWNSSVGVNSSITIPRGYHSGEGKVSNSVATMGAQTITPSKNSQTVYCSGKYMTGNITVNGTNVFKSWSYTAVPNVSSSSKGIKDPNTGKTLYYRTFHVYPSGFKSIYSVIWVINGELGWIYSGGSGHYYVGGSYNYAHMIGSGYLTFKTTDIEIPTNEYSSTKSTCWLMIAGISS